MGIEVKEKPAKLELNDSFGEAKGCVCKHSFDAVNVICLGKLQKLMKTAPPGKTIGFHIILLIYLKMTSML